MRSAADSSPLEDVEYLARSDHRVTVLVSLARGPRTRAELLDRTGVSQSTMGRTLREFEDRNWVRRDGPYYRATQPGIFVACAVADLIERIDTERQLRGLWRWLPDADSGFSIEMCLDAVVTVAEADDPYRPVNRFRSLLDGTDSFRFAGFDLALLEPCRDELCGRIVDGMRAEVIDPPNVVRHIRTNYPEQFAETLASGNLTLRLHDDLSPYGVGILDDRTVVSGYDPDSGAVQVLIDTDSPDARAWAESTLQTYRREVPTIALEPLVE